MGCVHVLPGLPSEREGARRLDAEGRAIFTLRELEAWLTVQIAAPITIASTQPCSGRRSRLARPAGRGDFDLPPDRMAFWTAFLPRIGAGWRKTAFTSRKSATGQTPCPERLGEEVSCWSNTIHVIFPASSCASRVDASSKRGTATSLIRP